jgi:hypothetical protein
MQVNIHRALNREPNYAIEMMKLSEVIKSTLSLKNVTMRFMKFNEHKAERSERAQQKSQLKHRGEVNGLIFGLLKAVKLERIPFVCLLGCAGAESCRKLNSN